MAVIRASALLGNAPKSSGGMSTYKDEASNVSKPNVTPEGKIPLVKSALKYQNKSGRSGVDEFETEKDGIVVKFKDGSTYRYSVADGNSPYLISQMHAMGNEGQYLNRLINSAQPKYTKLSGGEAVGYKYDNTQLRPEDERAMSKIHAKSSYGKDESFVGQLKQALHNKETSYSEWAKARNELRKFRK